MLCRFFYFFPWLRSFFSFSIIFLLFSLVTKLSLAYHNFSQLFIYFPLSSVIIIFFSIYLTHSSFSFFHLFTFFLSSFFLNLFILFPLLYFRLLHFCLTKTLYIKSKYTTLLATTLPPEFNLYFAAMILTFRIINFTFILQPCY